MMGDPLFLIAATGLGLSGIVSAIRLIDWFIHSDPKVIAQTGRLAAISLAVVSVPLLLGLLFTQKWTAAIALGAVMLLAFAFYGPQLLTRLMPRRLMPDRSYPAAAPRHTDGGSEAATADPELIQRSIAVLEEYLRQTAGISQHTESDARTPPAQPAQDRNRHNGNGHDRDRASAPLSEAEALEILGLGADATDWQISDAHRRLVALIHPDRGGSHYLTVKINQAKDTLLGATAERSLPEHSTPPRKHGRRRAQRPPQP